MKIRDWVRMAWRLLFKKRSLPIKLVFSHASAGLTSYGQSLENVEGYLFDPHYKLLESIMENCRGNLVEYERELVIEVGSLIEILHVIDGVSILRKGMDECPRCSGDVFNPNREDGPIPCPPCCEWIEDQ